MRSLTELATRRPIAVSVVAVAIALLGGIAMRQLPLDLLPDLQSPTIVVSVRSGDRPPTEMERLYGEVVETRLFAVRGIREVSEVARTGRLIASVVFEWEADMDLALIDVQKAVSPLSADPDVDEVLVRRFDPRQSPILTLGLLPTDPDADLDELRLIAERQLAPTMEQLDGVAEVRVLGGREKEVEVVADRYRLEAHGVTLATLESRLRAENRDVDVGTLEEGDQVFVVRGVSRFRTPEDIEQVVLRYPRADGVHHQPVRVADVATVHWGDRQIDHLVRVDGREGVGLSLFKEAGANTVEVARTARRALSSLEKDLPGVEVREISDASALVESAIADVEQAALLGIVLAVIVLALFLRSVGPTLIVTSAVPVSLLATLLVMRFGGQSLNIMTLAGLALGAGMLVDNAIVVVESIHRRLAAGEAPRRAAAVGTAEMLGAIAASTLTTCVVFLPVLFVRGLAARLVEGIAFSVVVSLLASLAVGALLIPALSSWFLSRPRGSAAAAVGESEGPLVEEAVTAEPLSGAGERTQQLVRWFLRRPASVVLVTALLCAGSVFLLLRLGSELLPPADPRELSLRVIGPPAQRVEATARVVADIESVLREVLGDQLEAIQSEVGRLPEDDRFITSELTEENTARILLRLSPNAPSGRQIVAAVDPVLARLAGNEIVWEVGASALSRALGNTQAPVVVEIAGESLDDLRITAQQLRERLAQQPELWNVRSSLEGGPPELHVILRRSLADSLQVDLDTLSSVLEASLDGREVTTMTTGDEERRVVVQLPNARRDELAAIPITTATGARTTVGAVARLEEVPGAREVFRRDQRRVAQVTARIAEGHSYPEALAATERQLREVAALPGQRIELIGEEAERQQTFDQLRLAGVLALVLVLMVLAGTFESLIHPITVLAAIPLALIGVAAALVPVGQPIGVMAALGIIVLAGVAVNDAILLIATARRLIEEGVERSAALARAAGIRLRPILMTTLTTALALVPLAFGHGEAAELRSPMALAILGGITASTVGSLLVIPCLYLLIDRLANAAAALVRVLRPSAAHEP